jgi:adenylate cyclase
MPGTVIISSREGMGRVFYLTLSISSPEKLVICVLITLESIEYTNQRLFSFEMKQSLSRHQAGDQDGSFFC